MLYGNIINYFSFLVVCCKIKRILLLVIIIQSFICHCLDNKFREKHRVSYRMKAKLNGNQNIVSSSNTSAIQINDQYDNHIECIKSAMKDNVIDYIRSTHLHGFNILATDIESCKNKKLRSNLNIIKIIFWSVFIFFGIVFGLHLICKAINRYKTTPTITTIESNSWPIWNVPFPAVTICNVNSVYKPNTVDLTQQLLKENITIENINVFYAHLSSLIVYEKVSNEFLKISRVIRKLGYTPKSLMLILIQPCNNMLRQCEWLGKNIDCNSIFRLARSESGFCCSFNYQALKPDLEIQNDNKTAQQTNAPIIKVSSSGADLGLRVLINVEPKEYVSPRRLIYGAEVIVHDPENFPDESFISAYGQPGMEVSLAVTPSIVVSNSDVKSLPPSLRSCYFAEEHPLKVLKKYDYNSCIFECKISTIWETCKCLPFFYPQIRARFYRECDLKDNKCLNDNRHLFSSLDPPADIYSVINLTSHGMLCDCLPSCTEHTYDIITFISERFNQQIPFMNTTGNQTDTLIKVYFKENSCIKYRREIFMGWDDLIASLGGILGLCLGGSVLSLLELIYFFTVKFYAKYAMHKENFTIGRSTQNLNINKKLYPSCNIVNEKQPFYIH